MSFLKTSADLYLDRHAQPAPAPISTIVDTAERVKAIRASLPMLARGEHQRQLRLTAEAAFGTLYSRKQISDHVRFSIPPRPGYERQADWTSITSYDQHIPDEALLKYQDAKDTGLLVDFAVVEPRYVKTPAPDPWIVARVKDLDDFSYVVIARWD